MGIRIFSITVIISIVAIITLHLPLIAVRSIAISPESDIDQATRAEMLAYAKRTLNERVYGVPGKARYFFKKKQFENILRKTFLQADTITIESSFLNKWQIIAKKRMTFGTRCVGMQCVVIDTKGKAFMKTDITVGNTLIVADTIHLGDYVFGSDESAITDFQKIPEVIHYLEESNFFVKSVSLRKDTRVVYIDLENGIGIWLDSSEALYDTTRALHIVFKEVFSDPVKQAEIVSVDVRNPLSILYEKK